MLTKFVGNVENLTKNAIVRSKMHIYLNWRMAAITILNFENRLPFLYYWTNPPHIWWDCWESDKERYCQIKNDCAAAILNCEKLLPFLHYLMGIWQIQFRMQPLYWKCTFNQIQCGGGRHLGFRKVVAISLLLDQCALHLVGMLRIWYETQCIVEKRKFTKSQDGGCRHFEMRKTFAISLLVDLFSPNLVGMLQIRCWMQLLSRKWAQGLN